MDGTPGNERFCSQCGVKLKGTSQFCPKCGLPAGGPLARQAVLRAGPGITFSSPVFMDISYRGQEFAWYWGLRLLAGGVVLVLLGLITGIASIEMGLFFGILGHFILLPGSVGFFAADYFSRKYDASAVAIAIILLLSLVLLAFRTGWGSYVVFLILSVIAGFFVRMYLMDHPGGA